MLDLVVCDKLYADFPEHQEGDLTKLKSAVVSRRTCAQVARQTGLSELLIVGKGIVGRREIPASLAAAVYESVVAAIHLDGGYEAAKKYVLATMTPPIDVIVKGEHAHNYKAVLQHHVQKVMNSVPHYELLDEKGPDHSKCFEMCVNIGGKRFEGAWGPNKKTAEQKAALMALRSLDLFDDLEFDAAIEVVDALAPQSLEALDPLD